MSQAKTERLVNLTMALLASRRYMKKSEIFRKVAGYSGSDETKERMFERDKDDLRALGIKIEVDSHDPLFEDEPGYRIKTESFQFPINDFTPEESSLISAALALWSSSEFGQGAKNASQRIFAENDFRSDLFGELVTPTEFEESGLIQAANALATRSKIQFTYKKSSDTPTETRSVMPYGLSTWQGGWYLVGEDLDKNDIRSFKLSRIVSKIEFTGKANAYEIPQDFNVKEYLVMFERDGVEAIWKVKKNAAYQIRHAASSITEIDEEWDRVTALVDSLDEVVRLSLWYSDAVICEGPEEARLRVIEALEEVMEFNG